MIRHFNIKITGKVQGVWFRGSMQREARRLGLRGFVRNEKDGSVYAQAEGQPDALEKLVAWCQKGPPLANVEKVEVEEDRVEGFSAFDIIRE
ncbi:MAG TPA: acylphosphatase [Bacteroidetes bacterium]|nr:acylphosphatase [Bacteroidota bacterium]